MGLSHTQRHEIRRQADEFLSRSKAYQSMSHGKKREIIRNTTDVLEFLAEDSGSVGTVLELLGKKPANARTSSRDDPYSRVLEDEKPLESEAPSSTDINFGEGMRQGIRGAGMLMDEVAFPVFVSELIKGVFQAIVDASIQQMQAYSELVQSVALSLNEFRDQNVSENQGRDHLVSKYPGMFQMDFSGDTPKVKPNQDAMFGDLPNFQSDFGLEQEISDLDEEIIENILVPAARNELAERRQKLLATMVLMGINRIIVTDGRINAKVKFTFQTYDTVDQDKHEENWQNMGNTEFNYSQNISSYYTKGGYEYNYKQPIIKCTSVTDTATDAQLQAMASVTGEVQVNFKSETLPLERLVDNDQVIRLSEINSSGRGVPPSNSNTQNPVAVLPGPSAV